MADCTLIQCSLQVLGSINLALCSTFDFLMTPLGMDKVIEFN